MTPRFNVLRPRRPRRAGSSGSVRLALFALGWLALWGGSVRADVSSVTTAPASVNIAIAQPTTVALTWNMVRNNTGTVGATVSSTHGVFRAGSTTGPVLGLVNAPLSATRPISGPSTTFSIGETVSIPASIAYHALKLGVPTVVYVRSFVDCTACTAGSGALVLPLSGASGAAFSVSRLSLRFDDDTAVRVVAQGAKLRAYADITFTGGGIFKGVWDIATPPSTQGKLEYRTVQRVHRALAGGDHVRLFTPALPTDEPGIYLLRLRVTQPPLPVKTDDLPFIRYVVTSEAVAGARDFAAGAEPTAPASSDGAGGR